MNSSDADAHLQQLDKLRSAYEECVKLGKELIPATEKLLDNLTEDHERKSQALDDVSDFSYLGISCLFTCLCLEV